MIRELSFREALNTAGCALLNPELNDCAAFDYKNEGAYDFLWDSGAMYEQTVSFYLD